MVDDQFSSENESLLENLNEFFNKNCMICQNINMGCPAQPSITSIKNCQEFGLFKRKNIDYTPEKQKRLMV